MNTALALALLASTAAPGPAWLDGEWTPYSNAFISLQQLTIRKDTLSWHGCGNVRFEVVEAKGNQVTIRLAKDAPCTLTDVPPSRIDTVRFTLRDNQCDLGVSLYSSAEAAAKNEPSAEGLYGKPKCPSGPASQAAANFSTTER